MSKPLSSFIHNIILARNHFGAATRQQNWKLNRDSPEGWLRARPAKAICCHILLPHQPAISH